MKTAQFTAIYFNYAMSDAMAYAATLGEWMQLHGVAVVLNAADKDGFVSWTATVTYADNTPVVAPVVAELDFTADVLAFVAKLQARENAENAVFPYAFSFEVGRKYTRIVKSISGSRSVYCFLDADGNIYLPAGWKGPAKHIRGTIYAADGGLAVCGRYGVAYLR